MHAPVRSVVSGWVLMVSGEVDVGQRSIGKR